MTKIIHHGRIYLEKGSFCEALLIENGRIVKTGSSGEILEAAPGGAEKIDAEGALVLPAFHDSHLHLMWVGRRMGNIEATEARSIDDVITLARDHIARLKPPPGTYIQGAGVNPDLFTSGEKRDLRREDMDKISTEHPVIISRHCGHTIYSNSLALSMAGIGESAPDVPGGTIEKDENGRPTGVTREGANGLVRKPMPAPSREDMKSFLKLGMKKAHSLGISACGSYDTGGTDFDNVAGIYKEIYDELRREGKPGLRVTMQCGISTREDMLDAFVKRFSSSAFPLWQDPVWGNFLSMGPIKLFVDGTLGGQTAWMKMPYRDKPETRGIPVLDESKLNLFVQKAAGAGLQVVIHAIGDAGVDAVITAFEKVTGPKHNPLRHGIIHCQVTSPDQLERMAHNSILGLVQPIFLADDMHILEGRVGPELASTSYAWGSMNRLGVPVSYGTDAPVSSLDPLLGIEWAVLRRDSENPSTQAFYPAEKVDIYTALDAYTEGAAFSGFQEKTLGRLKAGYLADLVFLDRDIFSAPPEEIHKAKCIKTFCAGELVYSAQG